MDTPRMDDHRHSDQVERVDFGGGMSGWVASTRPLTEDDKMHLELVVRGVWDEIDAEDEQP